MVHSLGWPWQSTKTGARLGAGGGAWLGVGDGARLGWVWRSTKTGARLGAGGGAWLGVGRGAQLGLGMAKHQNWCTAWGWRWCIARGWKWCRAWLSHGEAPKLVHGLGLEVVHS